VISFIFDFKSDAVFALIINVLRESQIVGFLALETLLPVARGIFLTVGENSE